ncbi:ketosteroid isomerase-like protein [Frankia torreyi]|uniref:Ketosteroid isomerase-like protein n=1 Tax=Frankia torreyi TaxID=1856 RepID=A0A0D8B6I8_9ACTN|nr:MULTISPECIES: nuclear transport factor 2 family protein [Frankia]KJE19705.1 ketosteroid isomerase-like protein [Frankia torreyi]KQM02618.1 ketosteroid isomerase-like protein [Frankia sp. CpI1-P]
MTAAATPTEVFHALADAVPRLVLGDRSQLEPLIALYAEPTDVRHPFAPFPAEPLRTRDDLRRHFSGATAAADGVESFAAVERTVHATADPEVVIGEFHYVGRAHARDFDVVCIFVLRVRGGRIVESRDYTDPVGFARAFGQLATLAAALVA